MDGSAAGHALATHEGEGSRQPSFTCLSEVDAFRWIANWVFLWSGVKAGTAVTLHAPLYVDRSIRFRYIMEVKYSHTSLAYHTSVNNWNPDDWTVLIVPRRRTTHICLELL